MPLRRSGRAPAAHRGPLVVDAPLGQAALDQGEPEDDEEEHQGHRAGPAQAGRRREALVEEVVDEDLRASSGPPGGAVIK